MPETAHSPPNPLTPAMRAPAPSTLVATYGESFRGAYQHRDLPWDHPTEPSHVKTLTQHTVGPKEGPCFMAATFRTDRHGQPIRLKNAAVSMNALMLDFDKGTATAWLDALMDSLGVAAVRYTTHSHMTTETKLATAKWEAHRTTGRTPADCLVAEGKLLPEIAEGAVVLREEVVAEAREGKAGIDETVETRTTVFGHKPCPKNRVILVFSTPWMIPADTTADQAAAAFLGVCKAILETIGCTGLVDETVLRLQSLVFLPRHAEGAPSDSAIFESNEAINPYAFTARVVAQPNATRRLLAASPFSPKAPADELMLGDMQGRAWAAKYRHRLLLTKLIAARASERFNGFSKANDDPQKTPWVGIDCPAHSHSTPGARSSTCVADACEGQGAAVNCQHNSCVESRKGDLLLFLKAMVDEGWFAAADLIDEEFLLPEDEPASDDDDDEPWAVRLSDIKPRPTSWIIDGLIGEKHVGLIAGGQGSLKTQDLITLEVCGITGRPFYGHEIVKTGPILHCALEDEDATHARRDAVCDDLDLTTEERALVARWFYVKSFNKGMKFPRDQAKLQQAIADIERIEARPVVVVGIDTLREVLTGSMSDEKDVSPVLDTVKAVARKGLAIVMTGHISADGAGKPLAERKPKGLTDFEDRLDLVIIKEADVNAGTSAFFTRKVKNGQARQQFNLTVNHFDGRVPSQTFANMGPAVHTTARQTKGADKVSDLLKLATLDKAVADCLRSIRGGHFSTKALAGLLVKQESFKLDVGIRTLEGLLPRLWEDKTRLCHNMYHPAAKADARWHCPEDLRGAFPGTTRRATHAGPGPEVVQ